MLFYMAAINKRSVGDKLRFVIRNKGSFRDFVGYATAEYAAIIRGFAVIEPEGETPIQYFMPKDTPYIVWREDGAGVDQCFFMKLDHRNPSECEGELTLDQVWEAVGNKIREEGSTDLPTDIPYLRRDLDYVLRNELTARISRRERRAGTFWGSGTSST